MTANVVAAPRFGVTVDSFRDGTLPPTRINRHTRGHFMDRVAAHIATERGRGLNTSADGEALAGLLGLVAAGDESAFARLYDAVSPRLFGLIYRIVADRTLAEEVCQETFLDLWRQAGAFDATRGSALSWMFTIAHRRSVDRVRSVAAARRREQTYGVAHQDAEYDSTVDQVAQRLDAERVRGALSTMTQVQRQAIELAYFGGLSHAQVAQELGIALGTAKSRIRDGLLSMRGALGGEA